MSRRRRLAIIVLCLLAAALLIWLDHSPIRSSFQPEPKSAAQESARDIERYHKKTFTVLNVVDGDTIDIDIPDGRHEHTRIRLWGVDTPEATGEKSGVMYFGPQAAGFTTKLAFGKSVTVYLDTARPTRGKYGRLLAYVQLPDRRFLNEVLLIEGFAYADLRFHHNFYHTYQQFQTAARSGKKGLWQEVTRNQLPEWLQRMNPNCL